jgi:hypothetical protein
MHLAIALILLLAGFLTGCATPAAAPWVQTERVYSTEPMNFFVELPEGWMRYTRDKYFLITRDGILLQRIAIERLNITDQHLRYTKKKFLKGMMPMEVAELALDNVSSNPEVLNFKVEENIPAKIGGFPGFRATYTQKNNDGLRLKTVYYGFMKDEWFYIIRYTAAQRYYFDKDIKTFETVVESFKLLKDT